MSTYQVQREDDLDFRGTEYADLYARAQATPFQHGVWLSTLYEELAPRKAAHRVVITVRDAAGRLVLVLPLVGRRHGLLRVLEFADLGVNDYAAAVIDPACASALNDRQLAGEIRNALGRFDLLRIERVADSPDGFVSLLAGARAKRHSYHTHTIELPDSLDGWREHLDPPFLRHLDRKYKRLRPKGARELRVITDPTEITSMMDRMRAFRAARFSERRGIDLVQDPGYYAFYSEAARQTVEHGPGRLVALELAGEPVAVAFDLVDETTELFLLVGFDVERLRNYSLGLIIVDELARAAIQSGLRCLDLTVGDESYKADFGARPRPLYEIRLPRTPLGAAGMVARDSYLGARRVAKKVVLAWEERQRRRKLEGRQGKQGQQGKDGAAA